LQFRYRGSRRESAVAQLFSLGLMSTIALSSFAAVVLTPVLMRLLARRFPTSTGTTVERESLQQQYHRLEVASQFAAFAGMFGSLAFVIMLHVGNTPWILGVMFGWLALVPVLLIAAFTLPRGIGRWREFWHYYEIKYRVSLSFIAPVYIALCLLGLVSTLVLFLR
jgi:multidrug efflux pump subunit AcrB